MVTSARFENLENEGFEGFPKMKLESYQSKMKQNSVTELRGYSCNYIYNINGTPDPLDPDIAFLPEFSGILCRKSGLVRWSYLEPDSIASETNKTWAMVMADVSNVCLLLVRGGIGLEHFEKP